MSVACPRKGERARRVVERKELRERGCRGDHHHGARCRGGLLNRAEMDDGRHLDCRWLNMDKATLGRCFYCISI